MTDYRSQSLHRNDAGRDREAAGAFTFRQMRPWQLWSITIASVVVVIGLIAYATA